MKFRNVFVAIEHKERAGQCTYALNNCVTFFN